MVNAKDLRIGNWVNFNTDNGVFALQIESVDKEKISAGFQVDYYDGDNSSPIPLTPEILEKCGFRKQSAEANGIGRYEWYDNGIYETVHVYKDWITFKGIDSIPIKHLHQLQNLYFALTGKELPINL